MNIERLLCDAFCDGITVEKVPAGLAVATAFEDAAGDRLAFYVVSDKKTGLYRLEDDGYLVPTLIAMGTDVTEGQRARLFQTILKQSGVEFDPNSGELCSELVSEDAVPMAAMRFISMLMRVAALSAPKPKERPSRRRSTGGPPSRFIRTESGSGLTTPSVPAARSPAPKASA